MASESPGVPMASEGWPSGPAGLKADVCLS